MFRRINSYTVPLNPEEQRHAIFQGDFKWFIYRLSNQYENSFLDMGVLTQKQVVRMADTKLLAEVCHALINGIKTTNKKTLDDLYRKLDKDFAEASSMGERIGRAIARLVSLEEVHQSPLMRPYAFYSLLLAVIHTEHPVEALAESYPITLPYKFDRDIAVANLSRFAEALEDPDATLEGSEGKDQRLASFVRASSEQTNVAKQRILRFQLLCDALKPTLM
jgi:hypothetical protein